MGEVGRCLLPIGVILRISDRAARRGSYGGRIVFDGCLGCGRMETLYLVVTAFGEMWVAAGGGTRYQVLKFQASTTIGAQRGLRIRITIHIKLTSVSSYYKVSAG